MAEHARPPDVVITPLAHRLTPIAQPAPPASITDPAAASPRPGIDDLLRRMQAGDRAAAAEFLLRYESRIRRRIRGKLGSDIRRLFDSLDIVSTLGRRLDLYVLSGQLQVQNEAQCLALLFKMADHALIDKARMFRQLEEVEGEDSEFAHRLSQRLREAEQQQKSGIDQEIQECMHTLRDAIDRRILSLWLAGEKHTGISELLQMTPTGVRKRWEHIKEALRMRLQAATAQPA